ncbi:O-antigen ligase family protein [Rhodocyclus tenuis]|uniref:O-antigen ligase n=1 Tax=Rhodocyclus tenuis TaxID=1066 RepID=A0A840G5K0_RHOTE|nr:O-antigen ligase family protein [Rhodocyclus tenuis]MBB4246631.1 O-antigen ligase [Rhodocyclus tenuis]
MRLTLALLSALSLLFVWSIKGTIALRYFLIASTLALLANEIGKLRWSDIKIIRIPLGLLGILSIWFVMQAIFISPETSWALGELKGQWLPALAALIAGVLLAKGISGTSSTRFINAATLMLGIVFVFSLQALIAVAQSLLHWLTTGALLRGLVPLTGGKLEMSFILNILLAFLTVDLLGRSTGRGRLLPVPLTVNLVCLSVALFAMYLAGARNGTIGLIFLSLSALFLYLYDQYPRIGPQRTAAIGIGVLALIGAFSWASYQADARWKVFGETAQLAWDIDNHEEWHRTSLPRPLLANGQPADESAYNRISWIRAGLRVIAEHPAGVGYGRNAFGHALREHYPHYRGHSHSGFVDLGSAVGLPGLLLWIAFMASLIWHGWKEFFGRERRLAGLVLVFLGTGFTGRMLIDSVNQDHMLQIFFFLTGVLLVVSAERKQAP